MSVICLKKKTDATKTSESPAKQRKRKMQRIKRIPVNTPGKGQLQIFLGPMFSGKSSRCFQERVTFQCARYTVVTLKPASDTRYAQGKLTTHIDNKGVLDVVVLSDIGEFETMNKEFQKTNVIQIDEANFFGFTGGKEDTAKSEAFIETVLKWRDSGRIVQVFAINSSFKRTHFGQIVPLLLPHYDELIPLYARCGFCSKKKATYSVLFAPEKEERQERLMSSEDKQTQVFVVGGQETYEAACGRCFAKVNALSNLTKSTTSITQDSNVSVSMSNNKTEEIVQSPSVPAVTAMTAAGVNFEESQYLHLVKEVIANGVDRMDRTGTGTLSKFGATMHFDLRNGQIPLLTSKKVYFRSIAEELLWMISGSTDAEKLREKKVDIWNANASRENLDKLGFKDRKVGDLGPVYGFQWRHFGAKYIDAKTDYTGQGVDQLQQVIKQLKTDPYGRRAIISAWNPVDLNQMTLAPCHSMCQFYVANGELSCLMYQRSCDLGLGAPFNIASYALFTRLVAQVVGLQPGDFIHHIGDAHVYKNHIDALTRQLENVPYPFPKLEINSAVTDIDSFTINDFTLINYKHHDPIRMKMAV